LDQADINKLVNGRYTGFSLRRLVSLLNKLDRDVELVVKKRPRSRSHATFKVRAA
jgi:predicted XRE-type DNA-binding protein